MEGCDLHRGSSVVLGRRIESLMRFCLDEMWSCGSIHDCYEDLRCVWLSIALVVYDVEHGVFGADTVIDRAGGFVWT